MRSLGDFNEEDLGLYFSQTYCMNMDTGVPVFIDSTGNDEYFDEDADEHRHETCIRDPRGRTHRPQDLRQWWPPTRSITVVTPTAELYGVHCSRHAVRQSRRSVSLDGMECMNVMLSTRMQFEEFVAGELANPVHTCEANVPAIEAFIKEHSQLTIHSFAIGPRLVYAPIADYPGGMQGKLYYAGQGYVGKVSWKERRFEPLSPKLARCRRVQTICEAIWRNTDDLS